MCVLHHEKMTDSSQFVVDFMGTSVYQMINDESGDLKQDGNYAERDYDVNIRDEKISLSQYYSQFADGTPDLVSGCVTHKTTNPVNNINNSVISYNLYSEQEAAKYSVKKPKIWKCTRNCGKIFTQEKYMRNHILVMHEKTSLIQCKICSLYLSTKARLKNHMIRHLGVDRLVCLICINKRANDKSCMRHHLSEKHGINSKHSLFHECYYELSLKEISLMKKSNSVGLDGGGGECVKHPSVCKKSANDIEELKRKIMEKSKRVKKLLKLMNSPNDSGGKEEVREIDKLENESTSYVENVFQICFPEPQKIVTAENGMKLMKLPNGQFRKIASN